MFHEPQLSGKLQHIKLIVEASQAMSQERSSTLLSSPASAQAAASQYVIGADIGGTSLRLALANGAGAIVGRWSASTIGTADATMVLRLMREGVDRLLREASLPPESLSAIAAGDVARFEGIFNRGRAMREGLK